MFGFLGKVGNFARDTIRGMGRLSDVERAGLSPEAADRLEAFRASQSFGDLMGDMFSNAPVRSTRKTPLRQMQSPILDQPQGPAFSARTITPSGDDRRRQMMAEILRRY